MLPRLFVIFLASDPFKDFRVGFAGVIAKIFLLVLFITLGATAYHVLQGDRDSAKKLLKWVVIGAVGFTIIEVIKNL